MARNSKEYQAEAERQERVKREAARIRLVEFLDRIGNPPSFAGTAVGAFDWAIGEELMTGSIIRSWESRGWVRCRNPSGPTRTWVVIQ